MDDERDDTLRVLAKAARAQAATASAWVGEHRAWARDLRAELTDLQEQSAAEERRALRAWQQGLDLYVAAVEARIRTDGVRALAEAAGARARAVRTPAG